MSVVKEIAYSKIQILLSLLTSCHSKPDYFWNTKEAILKNVGNQIVLGPIEWMNDAFI